MDDDTQIWLQAHLTVQAYVQQTILTAIIASAPDRSAALHSIGDGFRKSLQFRMLAPPIETRPNDDLRVQAAAIRIFDDFLAQVRDGSGVVAQRASGDATPRPPSR